MNRLVVRRSAPDPDEVSGEWTFEDAGAALSPGRGCTARGDHAVVCRVTRSHGRVILDLGDGDDHAETPLGPVHVTGGDGDDVLDLVSGSASGGGGGDTVVLGAGMVHGGPGDDRISIAEGAFADGGPGDDLLLGGTGRDVLAGGGGIDTLAGGEGDDALRDGDGQSVGNVQPVDRDVLDGGPGRDGVNYHTHTEPLRIDLAATGPWGQASDGDLLQRVEDVVGGAGADVLLGGDGPNELDGRSGDDVITGRDGDDRLLGWGGRDHLDAGGGDDILAGGDRADVLLAGAGADRLDTGGDFFVDDVDCGDGPDRTVSDRRDRLAGCESVELHAPPRRFFDPFRPLDRRSRRLRLAYYCVDVREDCSGSVRVAVRRPEGWSSLGSARFSCDVPAGEECATVAHSEWLRLPRAALRRLRASGRLRVRTVTTFGEPGSGAIPVRRHLWLRSRRR